jgi:uncharacterized membrane protein
MSRERALVAGLLVGLAVVAISLWAYPALPARVPTHWNLHGHVNGYSSRAFAASLTPAIVCLLWLLMLALPAISPRGFKLGESAASFYVATLAVMIVLLVIHFALLRAALTSTAPSFTLVFGSIGALMAVIGSLLGRLKKNFWIGVRTPWTLSNDEVWARTNRVTGQILIAGGLVTVAASFFGTVAVVTLIAAVAVVVTVSIVYSFVLYRRIEGFGSDS